MSVRFNAASENLLRTASVPAWGDFSVMWWAYSATDTGDYAPMFTIYESGGGTGLGAGVNYGTGGDPFIRRLTGAEQASSAGDWATGGWRRFAMVFDNTANTLTLYEGSDDETTNLTQTAQLTETGSITTDTIRFAKSDMIFTDYDGRVANMKLYSAVLSTTRLKEELAYFNVQDNTNLWASWPLKLHTDLTDTSGNSRNWTATGTLSTEADPAIDDDPGGDVTLALSGNASTVGRGTQTPGIEVPL